MNVIEFNICHIQSLICILVLIGSVSSLARTKWCRLLLVVPLLMKSIMPTSNLPRLCYSASYNFFFWFKASYNICFILLGLLHIFWNIISSASWWWWTAYYWYAKGRGWKVSSVSRSLLFFSRLALVKTTVCLFYLYCIYLSRGYMSQIHFFEHLIWSNFRCWNL